MTRRQETVALALILAGALALRLFFLLSWPNSYDAESEGYSKLNLMLQWTHSPLPYPDINFGPLHTVLLAIPYRLTGDALFPNRVLTLGFGLLLFVPFYRLLRRHFGPAPALGGTMILGVLHPVLAGSVVTSAEVPFVCCTLLALDWLDQVAAGRAEWWRVVAAAASATAASALRFEGWPLLVVYVVWLAAHRQWRATVIFTALVAVFPLVHLYVCWEVTNHPFWFLTVSSEVSSVDTANMSAGERFGILLAAFRDTTGWLGLALGLLGSLIALARRRAALVVVCFWFALAMIAKKSIDGTLDPRLLRYLALPATFVAMFAVAPVWSAIPEARRQRPWATAAVLLVAAMVAAFTNANWLRAQREFQPNWEVFEMLDRLRPLWQPTDRTLLGNEYHPVIVVESGLDWAQFRRPTYNAAGQLDPTEIAQIVREWAPTVLLVDRQEEGFVFGLGLTDQTELRVADRTYRLMLKYARWSVFRLIE